jgi:hypothetical protein
VSVGAALLAAAEGGGGSIVPGWIQNSVAVVSILGFLTATLAWTVKGAVRYIDERDSQVHDRLAVSIEHGDSALAGALDRLTDQLDRMASQTDRKIEELGEKMDAALYQLEHTNDGGTVRGALSEARSDIRILGQRVEHIEGDIRRNHPAGGGDQ